MTQIRGKENEPLAERRRSHGFAVTEYDAHQEVLRQRDWKFADVPFYEGKGAEHDPFAWNDLDYLDTYRQIYGRRCGSAGIGTLREVGITRPSADDEYSNHPYFHEALRRFLEDGGRSSKVQVRLPPGTGPGQA